MRTFIFVLALLCAPSVVLAQHQSPDTSSASPVVLNSDVAVAVGEAEVNPRSRARELGLTRSERALALYLGRTTFNEALDNEPDLAMIWNIARANGSTSQQIIDWLRSHSSCVMGVVPRHEAARRPGNCIWTRDLLPLPNARPSGFVQCVDENRDGEVDFDCHGNWSRVNRRWLVHLQNAIEYVAGEREMIMCPVTPATWDGRRWAEEAIERGHVPLGCKYTRNEGYVREGSPLLVELE